VLALQAVAVAKDFAVVFSQSPVLPAVALFLLTSLRVAILPKLQIFQRGPQPLVTGSAPAPLRGFVLEIRDDDRLCHFSCTVLICF